MAAGHATECVLERDDTPGKNPRKVVTVYSRDEMDLLVSAARGVDLHCGPSSRC